MTTRRTWRQVAFAAAVVLASACVTTTDGTTPRPPAGCPGIAIDFGNLESYRNRRLGIEIAARYGAPVLAAAPGVVVFVGERRAGPQVRENADLNKAVVIYHGGMLTSTGEEWFVATHYDRLSRFADGLEEGDYVRRGQRLGDNGASGASGLDAAPRLHFATKASGSADIDRGHSWLNPHEFWWQAAPGERAIHPFDPAQDYGDPASAEDWTPATRISGLTYPTAC